MIASLDLHQHFRAIAQLYRADETACLQRLLPAAALPAPERNRAAHHAADWIAAIRAAPRAATSLNDLLGRFGLTSQEGLALMCLAEALLRIPDQATADALIRDKLSEAHWNEALGTGAPWAMNVAGWALALTGKVIRLDDPTTQSPGQALGRLVGRLGQPIIREAIRHAMQWLADQFVLGQGIAAALARARPKMQDGVRFSFDMLGEGARTRADADRYYQDYVDAIAAAGAFQASVKAPRPSGISVKLSALHPRYEAAQREQVLRDLVPQLAALCAVSARHGLPLTIDAEEAERLQLSLEIAAALLPQVPAGWHGLGFAVQAYQKRAPAVIDFFTDLAKTHGQQLHLRLVKGAYWDTEIKRAQERGFSDFPVYTRKVNTDVSYLACALRMLTAGDAICPVFGTHNAMTVAHIIELAGGPERVEFQRLHGMGEELYRLLQREGYATCIYAPVGNHDVLLGYLVRRILENGANSSFVHRLLDRDVSVAQLTADPAAVAAALHKIRHPAIRLPADILPGRCNSAGLDLTDPFAAEPLLQAMATARAARMEPALPDQPVDGLFAAALQAQPAWAQTPVETRAACLEKLGELLEQHRAGLIALLVDEGGKTVPDALGEVRETVDFCRYYAQRARIDFAPQSLPGPTGERNTLRLTGRGIFVCISPWNFPLAIFLGQVAAALVAGNCVIAKPAPQTPRIAHAAARLIREAGVPAAVCQLKTGGPDIGAELVRHAAVAGVAFTGSTAAARAINRALAAKDGPIVPLIAETGGQNALIVDSSALPEQVVDDVLTSAFRSAGQRCSALRLLCLPLSTADKILTMLTGAMRELRLGDPSRLDTDIGPVIDGAAQTRLRDHVARLRGEARELFTLPLDTQGFRGYFVAPQVWEIPSIDWLTGEVFGPILHVVRYAETDLAALISQINATGFGLTGGIHSRIDRTVAQVERNLQVGNLYVNRSLIGAVVGSQPFGGQGLSGTGPKAGGPHYLPRFAHERVTSNNVTAAGGNASLLAADGGD